jgi:hypothetical protein
MIALLQAWGLTRPQRRSKGRKSWRAGVREEGLDPAVNRTCSSRARAFLVYPSTLHVYNESFRTPPGRLLGLSCSTASPQYK